MDLNHEIRSFTPIDIEKFSQENNVSEKIIDSVKAYNKAIEYLKTGSEDIAMIELKRVVAVNPDFYEAINLLGLCYAYTNQLDKAQELFGKVVQSENTVLKAADYLNFVTTGDTSSPKKGLKINKSISKTQNVKQAQKNKPTNKETQPVKKEPYGEEVQAELILFKKLGEQFRKPYFAIAFNLFGVLCLAAALIFFVMTVKDSKKENIEDEPSTNAVVNDDLNKTLAENNELQKQLEAARVELKQYKLSSELSQVSSLYSQGNYVSAADKLDTIPVEELSAEQKKKYDSIKSNVYSKAASALTTQGNTLFNNKKYAEAIDKLERVFKLGDNWNFGDKALYILGKSYVAQGDNQKGAAAYQKLISQYPNSRYTSYAKSRLKAIQP